MPDPVIRLTDAFKGYTHDQDKLHDPAQTLRKVKARLAHLKLDILQETRRIDTGRLDIPVYFSVCGEDARNIIGNRKQMGKGATPEQAEASAVMELVERFSFFAFCKNQQHLVEGTRARICQQTGARVLDFASIARSVHDPEPDNPAVQAIFENLPLKWTQAWSLTHQELCWIPFDWFFAINEFNGPSAGNVVEEALIQGICEIVERHVSALVSRNTLAVPGIDLNTVNDVCCQEMIEKYRRNGIQLFASDFSLDLGIPSVGVLAYDQLTFPQSSEIVWTAGTTPHPEKALSRALTETAQLAGDFNTDSRYVASGLPKLRRLADARFITNPNQQVSIDRLPNIAHPNMRHEVEACVQALARQDMEVLIINTTHSELGIPAFYTIVPGAHFRERTQGASVGLFAARLLFEKTPADQVIEPLTAMARALPNKYYLNFYLGAAHLALKNYALALEHFKNARDLDPPPQDVVSIFAYMGICLKDMQDYAGALAILTEGARLDETRTDIHNLMGFCHFKRREHLEAIACFEKVLTINPGSAIDYANIASNYRDMGKSAEAVDYYQRALALDQSIDFARSNLEKLLVDTVDH